VAKSWQTLFEDTYRTLTSVYDDVAGSNPASSAKRRE